MKRYFILLLTLYLPVIAQSTFCNGWDDGYAAGMKVLKDDIYITPICPIPGIGQDTYEVGYSKGYERATGNSITLIKPDNNVDNKDEEEFCRGWENGFISAMEKYNKSIYIIPICPIAHFNADRYDDGYVKGYSRGLENLGVTEEPNATVQDQPGQGFCDGWERGYQFGLQEWATENDKSKPSKTTPICPIPPIKQDTYSNGFQLGKERAKADMQN